MPTNRKPKALVPSLSVMELDSDSYEIAADSIASAREREFLLRGIGYSRKEYIILEKVEGSSKQEILFTKSSYRVRINNYHLSCQLDGFTTTYDFLLLLLDKLRSKERSSSRIMRESLVS